jgi:hypothetical protein
MHSRSTSLCALRWARQSKPGASCSRRSNLSAAGRISCSASHHRGQARLPIVQSHALPTPPVASLGLIIPSFACQNSLFLRSSAFKSRGRGFHPKASTWRDCGQPDWLMEQNTLDRLAAWLVVVPPISPPKSLLKPHMVARQRSIIILLRNLAFSCLRFQSFLQ